MPDKQKREVQGKVNKIARAIDKRAKAGPSGRGKTTGSVKPRKV
jgi:hypothetical protein